MDPSETLQNAISLIRQGDKKRAQEILIRLLREDPSNEMTWMWLVETLATNALKIAALEECLKHNPGSQKAVMALDYFRGNKPTMSQPAIHPTARETLSRPVAPSTPDDDNIAQLRAEAAQLPMPDRSEQDQEMEPVKEEKKEKPGKKGKVEKVNKRKPVWFWLLIILLGILSAIGILLVIILKPSLPTLDLSSLFPTRQAPAATLESAALEPTPTLQPVVQGQPEILFMEEGLTYTIILGELHPTEFAAEVDQPLLSPDGRQIAYFYNGFAAVRDRNGTRPRENMDIATLENFSGFPCGEVVMMAWQLDGNTLSLVCGDRRGSAIDLNGIITLDANNSQLLTAWNLGGFNLTTSLINWNPQGTMLVLLDEHDNLYQLDILNTTLQGFSTSEITNITLPEEIEWGSQFFWDDASNFYIPVIPAKDENDIRPNGVYLARANITGIIEGVASITYQYPIDGIPMSISPDGTMLVYSIQEGTFRVSIPDGASYRISSPAEIYGWTPNSQFIALNAEEEGALMINTAGTSYRIGRTGFGILHAYWVDNDTILYTQANGDLEDIYSMNITDDLPYLVWESGIFLGYIQTADPNPLVQATAAVDMAGTPQPLATVQAYGNPIPGLSPQMLMQYFAGRGLACGELQLNADGSYENTCQVTAFMTSMMVNFRGSNSDNVTTILAGVQNFGGDPPNPEMTLSFLQYAANALFQGMDDPAAGQWVASSVSSLSEGDEMINEFGGADYRLVYAGYPQLQIRGQ